MRSKQFRARAFLVAPFFLAVVFFGYARRTEPSLLCFEDLGRLYLPMTAFSYRSPLLAARPVAAPEYFLGAAGYGVAMQETPIAVVLPWFNRLLSPLAPSTIPELSVFEWRLTAVFMLLGMAGLFLLMTRKGMNPALAAAFTVAFPFTGPIFREWQHTPELRGRLLIPLALLGLDWALEKRTYASWLLAGALVLAVVSQHSVLYWMIPVSVLWVASDFLSRPQRSSGLRQAGPPTSALALVLVFIFPAYHQLSEALGHSAFRASLARPAEFIKYFGQLKDNCSLDQLLQPFPWNGAGLTPLFLSALFLALGCFLQRALYPKTPAIRVSNSAKFGLLLLALGLTASSVPLLPDRRVLSWVFPSALSSFLALLFHVSWRTWLVMAYSGGLLFLASFVPDWIDSKIGAETRMRQAGFALAAYAYLLGWAMYLSEGRADLKTLGESSAFLAAALAGLALTAGEKPWRRASGLVLLLLIGTASSLRLSALYLGKIDQTSYGRNLMNAEAEIVAHAPAGVKDQYAYRVVADSAFPNLCLYLRCSSLESYPVRALPDDVFRFFDSLGVLKDVSFPYFAHFDYERLSALGLVKMLGLKYWILVSPPPSFLAGIKPTTVSSVGPVRYYELGGVFARAWPLRRWTTADAPDECARRVSRLGAAGALDREGVLTTAEGAALASDRPQASGASGRTEILESEPGRILGRTKNSREVVLATNEVYDQSWNVTVDGKTERPLRVDCIFLGAGVAPGEHSVEFSQAGAAASPRKL